MRYLAILVITLFALSLVTSASAYSGCIVTADEGDLIKLRPEAFDPDPEIGPAGRLIWTFYNPFNASGEWQTMKGMRGIYHFRLAVTDGEFTDKKLDCVDLQYKNQNPVLEDIDDVTVTIGQPASINAVCTDPDEDPVTITYQLKKADIYGAFSYDQAGDYSFRVTCEDGFGGRDTKLAKLHVLPIQPPSTPKKIVTTTTTKVTEETEEEVKPRTPLCPPKKVVPKPAPKPAPTPVPKEEPKDDLQVVLNPGFVPVQKIDFPDSKTFSLSYTDEISVKEKCPCNGNGSEKIFLDESCCVYAKVGNPVFYETETTQKIVTSFIIP